MTAATFLAHVRFLTQGEGGRSSSPRNPAVSQVAVPPFHTSRLIHSCWQLGSDKGFRCF